MSKANDERSKVEERKNEDAQHESIYSTYPISRHTPFHAMNRDLITTAAVISIVT